MKLKQRSIGLEAAIALSKSDWWKDKTPHEIAFFQMETAELCCPFSVFHEAMEKALGRPVWTHEFGLDFDGLYRELCGDRSKPDMQAIIDLIPKDKRLVIGFDSGKEAQP